MSSENMKINVAQQLKEPVGSTRKYVLHETMETLEGEVSPYIDGELNFLRTDKGILVMGILATSTRCVCGRCLEKYDQSLNLHLEEEYYPTVDVVTGLPLLPLPVEGENALTIDQNHILDLSEAVRQYVIIAIPMKPLCKVDCAGLCPSCGANLNEGRCKCPSPGVDPRWARLREFAPSGGESETRE